MIREFIARLKSRAKKVADAFNAKAGAAFRKVLPPNPVRAVLVLFIVASEGNVLETGTRYRKTSGHAPLFSLYTFFANR
ncbi:MAG: hypothetical protein LUP97_08280 [Methanoregula sp.]|nr:hypothetical protein [Methanoregula sp.]